MLPLRYALICYYFDYHADAIVVIAGAHAADLRADVCAFSRCFYFTRAALLLCLRLLRLMPSIDDAVSCFERCHAIAEDARRCMRAADIAFCAQDYARAAQRMSALRRRSLLPRVAIHDDMTRRYARLFRHDITPPMLSAALFCRLLLFRCFDDY